MVNGIDTTNKTIGQCTVCVKGKQTRNSFKSVGTRAKNVLDLIHSDVCGPMSQTSLGGANYFVLFVDDFSRKTFLYPMKTKSEVVDKFIEFKNRVECETGRKIRKFRSDIGGEYICGRLKAYFKQHGIQHQTTTPYTPEQNGLAERMNRTIVEKARCMLFDSDLSKQFWAEAVSTAAYIVNRLPCGNDMDVTPEEAWTGRKPDVKAFRIFGSKAMVHIPKQCRKKLDSKSKECTMVGYSENSKAYRLYDPEQRKIIVSRDVVFFEKDISARELAKNATSGAIKTVAPSEKCRGNSQFKNVNNCSSFLYNFDETDDESQESIIDDREPALNDSFHDAEEEPSQIEDSIVSISSAETDSSSSFVDDPNDPDYVPPSHTSSELDSYICIQWEIQAPYVKLWPGQMPNAGKRRCKKSIVRYLRTTHGN